MAKNDKRKQVDRKKPQAGSSPKPADAAEDASGESKPSGHIDTDVSTAATSGIPVVGLGGSAGALGAFTEFFEAMPSDSGSAFVVIQHLAPAHTSLLSELLAQHTTMRVTEVQEGGPVEPNCVYVIPPGKYLRLGDGVLHLDKPVLEHGIKMSIDYFFRSLAVDRQERAICVLFSGAGSDGTAGARAVRSAGGLTIAQDQTAQFGDMPHSAVATGVVDFVLPPAKMPAAILDYLRQPYVRGGETAAVLEAEGKAGGLNEILATVRARTGCDFRCYKKSTILRRIERRMGLHRLSDIARYSALLENNADEVAQLYKDLLINVTAFFRDAEAFEELRRKAISPLVAAKQTDDPVRVWVAGCSTGEEAYSLAILLTEELAACRKACSVQIFATDIDDEALQQARVGIYPASIAADVGAARLTRFFAMKDHGYQVSESLRSLVIFAAQNLITDPPFSKMDIVSCRNMMIYLDAETQAKLIPLFNFALNPGGHLFLGKSEGVGGQHELFDTVSKKARVFRRLVPARPIALDTPIVPGVRRMLPPAGSSAGKPQPVPYTDAIRQALLSHFAASLVLVSRKGQVLQFHGQTGKYLNQPTGEPTLNLLDMAKEGLSSKLRSAIHQAADDGKLVVTEDIAIAQAEGPPQFARVTVMPMARRGQDEPLLAVIFEDVPRPVFAEARPVQDGQNASAIKQLEDELHLTQQDLQSTIEELQAANEELRVANEEVISSNEELQSTNEELETSKEELQSTNEELTTVNSQLQEKVQNLDAANSDIANLLESTEIATLFLDKELRIRMFTPTATRLMKLIPSDTGRPISDLSMNFVGYDLTADATAVAHGGPVVEREVWHADGSFYLTRILPHRTRTKTVDGVAITFTDMSRLRRAEAQTRRLATVLRDSNDAVILCDRDGSILLWNRGAELMYGWSEAEALGLNVQKLVPAGRRAELAELTRRLLAGETVTSFETQRRTKDGRVLDVWLTGTAVWDESGKTVEAIATTERDSTERAQTLRQSREDLNRAQEVAQIGSWRLDVRRDVLTWSDENHRIFGVAKGTVKNHETFLESVHPDDREYVDGRWKAGLRGEPFDVEHRIVVGGQVKWVKEKAQLEFDDAGELLGGFGITQDITERKRTEEALRKAADELANSNNELQQFAYMVSHDLQEPLRMVSGFGQILRDRYGRQLDAKAQEYIGFTVDGAERMSQMIRDLLEFSRVNMEERKPGSVDMKAACEQALVSCRRIIAEAGANVTCGDLPEVVGDRGRLVQLLQNLIGNAIKFHRPDVKPEVQIEAQREADHWVFRVKDNGIGISPDQTERIFQIFQRLNAREQYPGNGIGLSICRKIVERHGGRIWVESEPDCGSTFLFTIPVTPGYRDP